MLTSLWVQGLLLYVFRVSVIVILLTEDTVLGLVLQRYTVAGHIEHCSLLLVVLDFTDRLHFTLRAPPLFRPELRRSFTVVDFLSKLMRIFLSSSHRSLLRY